MSNKPLVTILILSADPIRQTQQLRLDEEVREIEASIERSPYRDQFQIIAKWAVRSKDIRRALLQYHPQIVHFSGHASDSTGLIIEKLGGRTYQFIGASSLENLFNLMRSRPSIQCVVFNTCNSKEQVEAISKHIDIVIGMNRDISDTSAIQFSSGFYDALGSGRSYTEAYKFGCNAISLEKQIEDSTPILVAKSDIHPLVTTRPDFFQKFLHAWKQLQEPNRSLGREMYISENQGKSFLMRTTKTLIGITIVTVTLIIFRLKTVESGLDRSLLPVLEPEQAQLPDEPGGNVAVVSDSSNIQISQHISESPNPEIFPNPETSISYQDFWHAIAVVDVPVIHHLSQEGMRIEPNDFPIYFLTLFTPATFNALYTSGALSQKACPSVSEQIIYPSSEVTKVLRGQFVSGENFYLSGKDFYLKIYREEGILSSVAEEVKKTCAHKDSEVRNILE
jgi:GTP:adenosylcobinamide-phosphate guanylyltransferase